MRKRTKLIIGLAVACAGCCILGACADEDYYANYAEDGYSVTVYYDSNGGLFASTSGVDMTDVYPLEQAVKGVTLIEPGSSLRGETILSTVSRSGYFLAGWYQTRELRTDENGNALDEDGNLCSVSGKEQGYIYSGKWDFENDKLTVPSDYTYTGEYTLVLYAAWIPNFSYAFYEEENGSWQQYGTTTFNPTLSSAITSIAIPELDEEGVAMVYGSFKQSSGKTFTAAYDDENKSVAITDAVVHEGTVDYEHGVSVNGIKYVYTEWKDGIWFNVYTPEHFVNNMRTDGCYNIMADLDFSGSSWSSSCSRGDFSGKIIGNNHTIKNVTITQTNTSDAYGGLFGRLLEGAVIQDITFENIVYTLSSGSRVTPSSFGLLAGYIASSATFTNVNVKGAFYIGDIYSISYDSYSIGLLCGNSASIDGITYEITCEIDTAAFSGDPTIRITVENGFVTISAA